MAFAASVTVLPLARRSTAVSCCGVSVQSGVSGFVGLCRAIGRHSSKNGLTPRCKTRAFLSGTCAPLSQPAEAEISLPLQPHALKASAPPHEPIERRFQGEVPRPLNRLLPH